jgi:hypothetical protein
LVSGRQQRTAPGTAPPRHHPGMRPPLVRLSVVLAAGACGADERVPHAADAAIDAAVALDAAADPFAGRYDSPDDFPATACTPGSLAGFARTEYWPALELRTAIVDGQLATYLGDALDETRVAHALTDDDLFLRHVSAAPFPLLRALRMCRARADGTLSGSHVLCFSIDPPAVECFVSAVTAAPFRRAAGEGDGAGLTLLGAWNGAPPWPGASLNVRVDGDRAYLARGTDGLRIVDVADPAAPVERGHVPGTGADFYNDVKLVPPAGGRRYVVAASTPSHILDVTDPAAPFLAADVPVSAHTVFVEGTTAYFATNGPGEVSAYDLTDPRAPRRLGGFAAAVGEPPLAVHDLHVEAGIAYLSAATDGLVIADFRDPAAPVLVGHEHANDNRYWHSPWLTRVGGRPLVVHGDESQNRGATGLRILDADPASPTFLANVGQWSSRAEVSIHNVMAFGARAYVAHYRDGLRVIDLSTPTAPVTVGYYNTWSPGTGTAATFGGAFGLDVDLARRRVYVADSFRGLMILSGDATVFP